MVILCCINSWEGVLIDILDNVCFVWFCMKKGSTGNHRSSQDWNDIIHANTARIDPYLFRTFQNQLWGSRTNLSCSKNIILCFREHSVPGTLFFILEPVPWNTELRPILLVVKWWSQLDQLLIGHEIWNFYFIKSILSFHYFIRFLAILTIWYYEQYKIIHFSAFVLNYAILGCPGSRCICMTARNCYHY